MPVNHAHAPRAGTSHARASAGDALAAVAPMTSLSSMIASAIALLRAIASGVFDLVSASADELVRLGPGGDFVQTLIHDRDGAAPAKIKAVAPSASVLAGSLGTLCQGEADDQGATTDRARLQWHELAHRHGALCVAVELLSRQAPPLTRSLAAVRTLAVTVVSRPARPGAALRSAPSPAASVAASGSGLRARRRPSARRRSTPVSTGEAMGAQQSLFVREVCESASV